MSETPATDHLSDRITIADVMEFLTDHRHQGEALWETARRMMVPVAMAVCYGRGQMRKAASLMGTSPRMLSYFLHGDGRMPALVECPIWREDQGHKPIHPRDAALSKASAQGGWLGGGVAAEGSGKTPHARASSASASEEHA